MAHLTDSLGVYLKLILFLFIGLYSLNSFSEDNEVIRLNAMKKVWGLLSENNRMRAYLSISCENYELNKWPIFANEKIKTISDVRLEEIIYNDFTTLCLKTTSENDIENLLSKDIYMDFILNKEDAFNEDSFSIKNILKKLSIDYQVRSRSTPIKTLLTIDELNSLNNYTDKSSPIYNACMRDNSKCTSEARWGIDKIKSAIEKINKASKNNKKEIYFRGVHSLPVAVLENIQKAVITKTPFILDNAFLSTSGKAAISKRFAGHFSSRDVNGLIFVIRSKNCVGIAGLSEWDTEDEFLCPAGMKFKIKDTGFEIPVDPGIGGLRPGELPHTPSKVFYLDEVESL